MAADELTSEDFESGQQVAQAGAEAAAQAPPAERKKAASRAVRQQAKDLKIEMTEEQANMVATAIIGQMEARGAFDAPPEPIQAPTAVAAGGEQVQQVPQPPQKRSFAEKFRANP